MLQIPPEPLCIQVQIVELEHHLRGQSAAVPHYGGAGVEELLPDVHGDAGAAFCGGCVSHAAEDLVELLLPVLRQQLLPHPRHKLPPVLGRPLLDQLHRALRRLLHGPHVAQQGPQVVHLLQEVRLHGGEVPLVDHDLLHRRGLRRGLGPARRAGLRLVGLELPVQPGGPAPPDSRIKPTIHSSEVNLGLDLQSLDQDVVALHDLVPPHAGADRGGFLSSGGLGGSFRYTGGEVLELGPQFLPQACHTRALGLRQTLALPPGRHVDIPRIQVHGERHGMDEDTVFLGLLLDLHLRCEGALELVHGPLGRVWVGGW
mmetsp:Transcript_2968/g.7037  ORF Transcript_2968/g.7037 Transcript_2968/m.7037 type:complete len:315 (-) Transcript_2968:219-1163(-)